MKKLLWIGDAACPSGFARATHYILDRVRYEYEVSVLGINFRGDSPDADQYPYDIYTAASGFDAFGINRLHWMCHRVQPDVIVIQQDGWNIPDYIQTLRLKRANGEYVLPEHAAIPVIAVVAVDGKNFRPEWLEGVTHTVFWTQFALDEARECGFTGSASVIPLGVDERIYYPMEKNDALEQLKFGMLSDRFIVGNVNRNQPRKRWDLTLRYFALWVKTYKVLDAVLYLHAAPTGDASIDVMQLAKYYGIDNMLAYREPEVFVGVNETTMRCTYNIFDVNVSTTQGEGFGLTTLEAMACGVPCIVPDWAALGDWARRGAMLIPCTSTATSLIYTPRGGMSAVNVIGGVPDEKLFVQALQRNYVDKAARAQNRQAALECAAQARYRWPNIGDAWVDVIDSVVGKEVVAAVH